MEKNRGWEGGALASRLHHEARGRHARTLVTDSAGKGGGGTRAS